MGFGPFQVRREAGVRSPVVSAVPLPWMASPTINPDPLGPDPDWNLYESRGFGLTRRESGTCHDTPNFANFRGFFQQPREELGRKVGFRSNFIGSSGGRQRHDFELVPAEKSGTRADAENQCGIRPSRFYQFSPLISRHDRSRGSGPNSSTRMRRAEEVCDLVDSKLVDFNLDLFLNLNHPSPIGREHGCSSSRRSPLYAQDLNYNAQEQRWFEQEQHLSVDPWHEAGNIDGSKCISRKRVGGVYLNGVEGAAACRTFSQDHHLIDHTAVLHHHDRQALAHPTGPAEAFSFWNMGRHKRAKTVSSAFPSFTMNIRGD